MTFLRRTRAEIDVIEKTPLLGKNGSTGRKNSSDCNFPGRKTEGPEPATPGGVAATLVPSDLACKRRSGEKSNP